MSTDWSFHAFSMTKFARALAAPSKAQAKTIDGVLDPESRGRIALALEAANGDCDSLPKVDRRLLNHALLETLGPVVFRRPAGKAWAKAFDWAPLSSGGIHFSIIEDLFEEAAPGRNWPHLNYLMVGRRLDDSPTSENDRWNNPAYCLLSPSQAQCLAKEAREGLADGCPMIEESVEELAELMERAGPRWVYGVCC